MSRNYSRVMYFSLTCGFVIFIVSDKIRFFFQNNTYRFLSRYVRVNIINVYLIIITLVHFFILNDSESEGRNVDMNSHLSFITI